MNNKTENNQYTKSKAHVLKGQHNLAQGFGVGKRINRHRLGVAVCNRILQSAIKNRCTHNKRIEGVMSNEND